MPTYWFLTTLKYPNFIWFFFFRYKTLFSPPLPEQKITLIEALSLGICDKMIFRFDHIWWPTNTYSVFVWRGADKASISEEDQWLLKVNAAGSPMASNNSLTLWVCGNAAKTVSTKICLEIFNSNSHIVN